MKKTELIVMGLLLGCVPKKRVDDLAFKFCDKVSNTKGEYLKCFTDIVECHSKSSEQFDSDLKFIECARLFQVKEPDAETFRYLPTLGDTEIDAQVWREIEGIDAADQRRRKKPEVSEAPKPAPKPSERPKPIIEYKTLPPEKEEKPKAEIARKLPGEVKWKLDKIKREAEEKAKAAQAEPMPTETLDPLPSKTPKPEDPEKFDF